MAETLTKGMQLTAEERLEAARIEALRESPSSRHDIEEYLLFLGLEGPDLRGKKILDVGAGPALFAREAKTRGAEAVSLDPRYCLPPEKLSLSEADFYRNGLESGELVVGVAQELPFDDEAFDLVVAVSSVPRYLPDIEPEKQLVLSEMLRVLKPGGEARVFPVLESGSGSMLITSKTVESLKTQGAEVEMRVVAEPIDAPEAPYYSLLTISKLKG